MNDHNIVIGLHDRTAAGAASARRNIDEVTSAADRLHRRNQEANGSLGGMATSMRAAAGAATALGASLAVGQVIRYADAWTSATNRLKLATETLADLQRAQASVFAIAQETRADFGSTADLYSRLERSTRDMARSDADLLAVVRTVNQAIAVSGSSASAANAAIVQLGQGFAAGALRGEELNSVLEQTPRLAEAIAKGLGVSLGQLRQLGAEGQLTAEKVFGAIRSQSEAVQAEFQRTNATIGQAFTSLTNASTQFVGRLNEATGAGEALARVMRDLASALESVTPSAGSGPMFSEQTKSRWSYGMYQPEGRSTSDQLWSRLSLGYYQPSLPYGAPMGAEPAAAGPMVSGAEYFSAGGYDAARAREKVDEAANSFYDKILEPLTQAARDAVQDNRLGDWQTENLRTPGGMAPFAGSTFGGTGYSPRLTTEVPLNMRGGGSSNAWVGLGTPLDDATERIGQLSDALGGLSPKLDDLLSAASKGVKGLEAGLTGDWFGAAVYGVGALTDALGWTSSESERAATALRTAAEELRRMREEAAGIGTQIGGAAFDDARQTITEPIRELYRSFLAEEQQGRYYDPNDQMDVALAQTNAIRRTMQDASEYGSGYEGRINSRLSGVLSGMGYSGLDQGEWERTAEILYGVDNIADITGDAFAYLAESLETSSAAAAKLADVELDLHYDALEMGLRQQLAADYRVAGADLHMQAQAYGTLMASVADLRTQQQLTTGSGAAASKPATGGGTGTPGSGTTQPAVLTPGDMLTLPSAEEFDAYYEDEWLESMVGGDGAFARYATQFVLGIRAHRAEPAVDDMVLLPDGDAFDAYYQETWLPSINGDLGIGRYSTEFVKAVYAHRARPRVIDMVELPTGDDFDSYYSQHWLPAINGDLGIGRYREQFILGVRAHRAEPTVADMVSLPDGDAFDAYYVRSWLPAINGDLGIGRYRSEFLAAIRAHRAEPTVGDMVALPAADAFDNHYSKTWLPAVNGELGIGRYRAEFLAAIRAHRAEPVVDDMVALPEAADFDNHYSKTWLPAVNGELGIGRYRSEFLAAVQAHRAEPTVSDMIALPEAAAFDSYYSKTWLPTVNGELGIGRYREEFVKAVYAHRANPRVNDMVQLPTPAEFDNYYTRTWLPAVYGDLGIGRYGQEFVKGAYVHRAKPTVSDMVDLPSKHDFDNYYSKTWLPTVYGNLGIGRYSEQFLAGVRAHQAQVTVNDMVSMVMTPGSMSIDFGFLYQFGVLTTTPAPVPLSQIINVQADDGFRDAVVAAVESAMRDRQITPEWRSY